MRSQKSFWVMAFVVITLFLVSAAGCTLHFKAKDVEMESEANLTYELRSVGVFDG